MSYYYKNPQSYLSKYLGNLKNTEQEDTASSNLIFYQNESPKMFDNIEMNSNKQVKTNVLMEKFDYNINKLSDYFMTHIELFEELYSNLPQEILEYTIIKYQSYDESKIIEIVEKYYTRFNIYENLDSIFYITRYFYLRKNNNITLDVRFRSFDNKYMEIVSPEYFEDFFKRMSGKNSLSKLTKKELIELNFAGFNNKTIEKCYQYLTSSEFRELLSYSMRLENLIVDSSNKKFYNVFNTDNNNNDNLYLSFTLGHLSNIMKNIGDEQREMMKDYIMKIIDM
jgi:hypothetical protein